MILTRSLSSIQKFAIVQAFWIIIIANAGDCQNPAQSSGNSASGNAQESFPSGDGQDDATANVQDFSGPGNGQIDVSGNGQGAAASGRELAVGFLPNDSTATSVNAQNTSVSGSGPSTAAGAGNAQNLVPSGNSQNSASGISPALGNGQNTVASRNGQNIAATNDQELLVPINRDFQLNFDTSKNVENRVSQGNSQVVLGSGNGETSSALKSSQHTGALGAAVELNAPLSVDQITLALESSLNDALSKEIKVASDPGERIIELCHMKRPKNIVVTPILKRNLQITWDKANITTFALQYPSGQVVKSSTPSFIVTLDNSGTIAIGDLVSYRNEVEQYTTEFICWIDDLNLLPEWPDVTASYGQNGYVTFELSQDSSASSAVGSFGIEILNSRWVNAEAQGSIVIEHALLLCPAEPLQYRFQWRPLDADITYRDFNFRILPVNEFETSCDFAADDEPDTFWIQWNVTGLNSDCREKFEVRIDGVTVILTEGIRQRWRFQDKTFQTGGIFLETFRWLWENPPENVTISFGFQTPIQCLNQENNVATEILEENDLQHLRSTVLVAGSALSPVYPVLFIAVLCVVSVMAATMCFYVKKTRESVQSQHQKMFSTMRDLMVGAAHATSRPLGASGSFCSKNAA